MNELLEKIYEEEQLEMRYLLKQDGLLKEVLSANTLNNDDEKEDENE